MFRLEVSHLQALTTFSLKMLCPLWDPIVFTVVEYVLAEDSRKVYNYSVTYRLCLNIKTLNHKDPFFTVRQCTAGALLC